MAKTYQVVELIRVSEEGVEEAIHHAIAQAAALHGQLDWYEVLETRGLFENNKHKSYQVHLKVGCNTH